MIRIVKGLNNKGLTAIEILVCFSIVVVIVMSMFKVVNNQKDKQTIESYKNSIITYKNTVTRTIEEDIKKGEGIAKIYSENTYNNTNEISIAFNLKKINSNGETTFRKILIKKEIDCDEEKEDTTCADVNSISYYYSSAENDKDVFKIPNIYNLKFNKIEDDIDDQYLKIYVGFNHPDLGNKYSALDLIEPINSNYF